MPHEVEDMSVDELLSWANRLIERHERIRVNLLELNDPDDVADIMDSAAPDLATIGRLLLVGSPPRHEIMDCARSLMSRQQKTFPEYVLFAEHVVKWATAEE